MKRMAARSSSVRGIATVISCLALACAAAERPVPSARRTPAEIAAEAAAAEAEVDRAERELGGLLAVGSGVDCAHAERLRDNICALAERICALLTPEGARPEPDGPQRCAGGRTRCKAAREKVAAACKK